MTGDVPLTRRRVLAGLAGAGALGSSAGAYTAATFGDRELIPAGMRAGSAGIDVDCSAPDCETEDGAVSFGIADISPGAAGRRTFTLSVVDNPVRVWLRTDCPTDSDRTDRSRDDRSRTDDVQPSNEIGDARETAVPQDGRLSEKGDPDRGREFGWPPWRDPRPDEPLQDALRVKLSTDEGCGGGAERLFPNDGRDSWGTLRDLKTALADGTRLDAAEACFSSSSDACLQLDYWLPRDVRVDDDASVGIDLELYAEQCRHVPETSVENPFEPNRCEHTDCRECVELGKLEVQNDRLEPSTIYQFTELYDPFAGDQYEYELEVIDVINKDDGHERSDDRDEVVERSGGRNDDRDDDDHDDDGEHGGGGSGETTCVEFRLLRDGEETVEMCTVDLKGGPRHRTYDLEPPQTRTPGKLCTSDGRADGNRGGSPKRPAISHLTVSVCGSARNGGDDE